MITNNFKMYLLTEESMYRQTFAPKTNLSSFEMYGLSKALEQFVQEYEEEHYGVKPDRNIMQYIKQDREDGYVDFLDGAYDTYVFDKYAINRLQVTDDGILLLNCWEVTPNKYEEYLEENIDYNKEVTFRLN